MKLKLLPILIVVLLMSLFNIYTYSQSEELQSPVLLSPANSDTLAADDTAFVWSSVEGADAYRLVMAIDSLYFTIIYLDTTVVGDTTLALQYLIGNEIRLGQKYYWHVRAENGNSVSEYSQAYAFTAFQTQKYLPAVSWYDVDNKLINAHGGGFLYDDISQNYYWYGESRPESGWCATGVSCYSSKNLLNWKFEGIVLSDSSTNSTGETPVLERPKVIYNDSTKKYVMWMHIDYSDYSLANAGVAVSDSPTGPFEYLGNERPNDAMSRDMTLFKDDDGKAYLFYSSEENATMYVSLLTDDYLSQSGTFSRNLINQSREAPAVFKFNGMYYLITSGCTGWDPNQAKYAFSYSPIGPWILSGNPCKGEDADITFGGQSTYILPVDGEAGKYIFMADKWNSNNLISSTYIWLPLVMDGSKPVINWYDSWSLSVFDETTDVEDNQDVIQNDYLLSQNYPNPFNPATTIEYRIGYFDHVTIEVYDILGRKVSLLVDEQKSPGAYKVSFDGTGLASGIYIYKLQAGNYFSAGKMILLK